MNFYRIHVADISDHTQQSRGLFVAIWKLVEAKRVTAQEEKTYWDNRKWFEANLPVPPFYAEGNPQKAITWYKNNEKGNSMCFRMAFYFDMAKKYSITMYKSIVEDTPGEIIYEDDFQIAVINHLPDAHVRTEKLIW